ncbi:hypothetical protein BV22DRAFT_1040065 [Leucogyrophana mollusca]|uniref:Uncharacterized protein n=1 Tax=Leucogyrophana mollusca TaxID=85980 RepID=A0ACB8B3F2_9AGAM|nr:hypothetical protein BV22DRAFT_1040065 [Leucogyrophana mollusca]
MVFPNSTLVPSLSRFERLVKPALEHVAYFLATDTLLGPPADLVSLLCTSRTVNELLCFANNSHLYARIFRFKFDSSAVERRLPIGWSSTPCLAVELRKRFAALKRIRRSSVEAFYHLDDLWVAYLMMLESDGRNEAQLFEWAQLPRWVDCVISYRIRASPESGSSWLLDSVGTSISLWLLWMSSNRETVGTEQSRRRNESMRLLCPFVVLAHKFSSAYAPDSHFYIPLCKSVQFLAPGSSGPPPEASKITYYGHRLTLAAPLLTPAALLNFVIRIEAQQDESVLPASISQLPENRVHAISLGLLGPRLTQEDVTDFHYGTRTRAFERHRLRVDSDGEEVQSSKRHDQDWFRLVSCRDLWADDSPLKGIVYPLGTLIGKWNGRILVPDPQAHLNVLVNPRGPTQNVPLYHERLACRFEEHHCLSPDEPLTAPSDAKGWGEDILSAWLPRFLKVERKNDGIEIFDPTTNQHTRYETYRPERSVPYSKPVWDKAQVAQTIWRSQTPALLQENLSDDEYEDVYEYKSSGVRDIIITGETSEREGDAWGHYSFIGRVRQWDGLIVLLRIPKNVADINRGRWIFKGYMHEHNLVGRWRETGTAMNGAGLEGGFVLCKGDE